MLFGRNWRMSGGKKEAMPGWFISVGPLWISYGTRYYKAVTIERAILIRLGRHSFVFAPESPLQ